MTCVLTQGFELDTCKAGTGGIRKAYIVEFDGVATMDVTGGVVASVDLLPGYTWRTYELKLGTSFFREPYEKDPETGTFVVRQEFTMVLFSQLTAVRQEIQRLAKQRLLVVVEDANGILFVLGATGGMDLVSGIVTPGQRTEDRSGAELIFTSVEGELAYFATSISTCTGDFEAADFEAADFEVCAETVADQGIFGIEYGPEFN
jgi:hypothetical protein